MRLAFIDLQFGWPPPGGAPFDLVNTMTELQRMGHDVRLFCVRDTRQWRFSGVDETASVGDACTI